MTHRYSHESLEQLDGVLGAPLFVVDVTPRVRIAGYRQQHEILMRLESCPAGEWQPHFGMCANAAPILLGAMAKAVVHARDAQLQLDHEAENAN